MEKTESLEDFYETKLAWLPGNLNKELGHFNVFKLDDFVGCTPIPYSRKAYFKIVLIVGKNRVHYADKVVDIEKQCLFFASPMIPYRWEYLADNQTGYFCIFKEAFFAGHLRGSIRELPMFTPGGKPGYVLNVSQDNHVSGIFEKMIEEIGSDYVYKYDLIRNYITEMIHYALKLQPTENLYQHVDANTRITAVFTELLERQFPIETPNQRFALRSAKDFAEKLTVHVNHLNRAIRTTTGKTTSEHIYERLTGEAKALLKHTNWNISEISYCLGFEEPAHFNHFFKKQTSQPPSAFRVS